MHNCKCQGKTIYEITDIRYHCFWEYLENNPEQHTLQEIADLFGKSTSWAALVERQALKKLKESVNFSD